MQKHTLGALEDTVSSRYQAPSVAQFDQCDLSRSQQVCPEENQLNPQFTQKAKQHENHNDPGNQTNKQKIKGIEFPMRMLTYCWWECTESKAPWLTVGCFL